MKKRTLMTTVEMLDALKSLNDNASDYRIAQILKVNKSAVSLWRKGTNTFSDETAIEVARLLKIKPEYVIACAHAERAKSDEARSVWTHFAAAFGTAAVFVLAVGILAPFHF
jgi:plasmid maintenance system antidote protein VapI